jgi:hypothetical protein
MVGERRTLRDTVLVVFERLNRSGDLNVILQALAEQRDSLQKQVNDEAPLVNIADLKELDEHRKKQGRLLEVKRIMNAFRHWGARKHYDGDGTEGTAERVTA